MYNKVIILFYVIILLYLLATKFIGFNLISNSTIISIFKINGNYKKDQLINTLNSFDVFNYQLYNNFLVKTKNKSYQIIHNDDNINNDSILIIYVYEFTDYHEFKVVATHKLFDMQLLLNIINDYINNNTNNKEMCIYRNFLPLISLIPSTICIVNLLKSNTNSCTNISFDKYYIEQIKNNSMNGSYLSDIDIVISLLTKNYMDHRNRSSCNISISKSIRNKQNKYKIGNIIMPNSVHIKNNNIENIAKTIRNSYTQKNIFIKECNIYITSWVPNKEISQNLTSVVPMSWYNNNSTNYNWGYKYNFIVLFFDRLTNKYNCYIENKS